MKILFIICLIFFPKTPLLSYPSLLNFTIENDSLGFFIDRYYTSGVKLEYQDSNLFSPIAYLAKALSFLANKNCFQTGSCLELNSYSLSHLIFTPALYKAYDPIPKDRAYAGIALFTNSNTLYFENFILNNQVSIGNLGSSSEGKLIQETIHKPFLFYTPRGWSHELRDKTIYHWDFLNILVFNKNLALPLGFRLGNWNQNLNLGLQIRFGEISSKNTFAVHSIQNTETSPYYSQEDEEEFYFFLQPRIFYQSKNWSISQKEEMEFDYRGILDDRTYLKNERYFLFNYGLLQPKTYEESITNFLIFNILFNGAEGFSRIEGKTIFYYIQEKDYDFSNPSVLLGLYSLTRPKDKLSYALTKYFAFQKSFSELGIDPETQKLWLSLLYLQGEFDRSKPIQSKLRNTNGEFQFGVVYKARNIFVNFAWSLATLDFETDPSLPQFHSWGRIKLGIYF